MVSYLTRVVIVGNGIAGLTAADTLRSHGFDGDLTIVGNEGCPAYSRPALSKALLREDEHLTAHELPAPTHGADERLGVGVVRLEPSTRRLELSDGDILEYDGLVIASGSHARRLGSLEDELVLRTLADALAIREQIADSADVVIVGAGPLGMEIASGALDAGCRVTIVTNATPMSRVLGEYLGSLLAAAAAERGANIVLTAAARIIEHGGRSAVELADGHIIVGDLLISAVGDSPNTEWLAGSGLVSGGPLVVDGRGRVRPEIVAAGDVAAFPTLGGHARSPLWNSAIAQAKTAAAGLLLGDNSPELAFQPYFWTEQFGRNIRVVGTTPLVGEPELVEGDRESGLLRWSRADGTATAVAIMVMSLRPWSAMSPRNIGRSEGSSSKSRA